jgi:xanthine dehydrogenase accessory factor
MRETLKRGGISEVALARVHAPIGLPIHAETPQEIAVSIMAEMIQVKRKGDS